MATKPLQADELFFQVLAIEEPKAQKQFLREACGEDLALLDRVQKLLESHRRSSRFLKAPVVEINQTVDDGHVREGRCIGPYKLLQELGEGGMGVVYMAEQTEPVRRKVALKVIKPGMDSRQIVARFKAEQQAMAMMDHPNIARVFEVGTTENGRPYFVMELVKGVPITKYCDENQLSTSERLELFTKVCSAIEHAHQKGIIHRDIKPSNILVAEYDDHPSPKVIDFGVAKAIGQDLVDATMFTRFGQILGTFEYMSPEQAKLNQWDVDTRSDIYSMGVLLYELLTGSTPFDTDRLRQAAIDEVLRIIREEEPPRPSTRLTTNATLPDIAAKRKAEPKRLGSMIRGELDWIVMKSMEKDRRRRYQTAGELAKDVHSHLSNDPVAACPPSTAYRMRKFATRYRSGIAIAASIFILMAGGVLGTSLFAVRATRAEQKATINLQAARKAQKEADAEATSAKQAMNLVLGVFGNYGTSAETGEDVSVTQAVRKLGQEIQNGTDLVPMAEAELNFELGRIFAVNGDLKLATKHFRLALPFFNAQSEQFAVQIAESRRYIAFVDRSLEKMLGIAEADADSNRDDFQSRSLALAANLQAENGDRESAAALAKKAVDLFDHDGPDRDLDEIPHFLLAELASPSVDEAKLREQEQIAANAAVSHKGAGRRYWWRQVEKLGLMGRETTANRALLVTDHIDAKVQSSWLRHLGINLRNQCVYTLADEVFIRAEKFGSRDSDMWASYAAMQRGRLRSELHDFAGAEEHAKRAISLNSKSFEDYYGMLYEYALLLRLLEREQEAKPLLEETLKFCTEANESKFPSKYGDFFTTVVRVPCAMFLGEDLNYSQILEEHSTDVTNDTWKQALIQAVCHDALGNDEKALEAYGRMALERGLRNELCCDDWAEVRMVAIAEEIEAMDTLVAILEKLKTHRDEILPQQHAGRAFIRERLAKALIRQGGQPERAATLISEAMTIMEPIALVPEAKRQEIADLHASVVEIKK